MPCTAGKELAGNSVPEQLTEAEHAVFMKLRSDPERISLAYSMKPLPGSGILIREHPGLSNRN